MSYIQSGGGGGGGSGTVTSVGLTVNGTSPSGIFTVSGSPVIAAGTLDVATAGTSGGVPYFSSGTVIGSSAALTSNALVLGGGAGAAPKVVAGLTTDGTAGLNVGATGVGGTVTIFGATSGSNTLTAPGNGSQLSLSATTVALGASGTVNVASGSLTLTSSTTLNLKGLGGSTVSSASVDILPTNSFTATTTTQIGLQGRGTFAPTSGTAAFSGIISNPTINQTGGANGTIRVLAAYPVNTALVGTEYLLALGTSSATGPTGTLTDKLAIDNNGLTKVYNGIATVSQGQPAEYATVDLTAQTAAITATTLYAVPAGGQGMYRISWSATITTVDGATSVLGGTNGFQIVYTSPTDSVAKTTVAGNSVTSAANTTGTAVGGCEVVYAKASTNIQYKYDYTSGTPGTMAYELHIKCEAL